MTIFFGTVFFAFFIASGIMISRSVFQNESAGIKLWFGGVFGLLLFIWLPACLAFVFGFTSGVQYGALFIAGCLGVLSACLTRRRNPTLQTAPLSKADYSVIFGLLPLLLIGIVLHFTHTIVERNGALYVGQSTYGDLAMHLGFITSISTQKTFPPMYSICPDTAVGYPFLCDSVSSTLYSLTGDLRFSALLPACFAYVLVVFGVFFFFRNWLKKNEKTLFAVYLFFLGGGFGFAYFFELLKQNPDNFSRIFYAFYETPTNYVGSGIKWVNPIADMLVPQRATLFGWAFLFPSLYLLMQVFETGSLRKALVLGVLAGGLPLIHTHSFLALGLVSACYLLISIAKKRNFASVLPYGLYLAIVILLAGPQLILFTFRQSGSFLQLHFNWANFYDTPIWFAVKNLGLLFVLALPAFIDTDHHNREICSGAVLIWLLAETIQFQPNSYDNNKLLFVSFAYLCGLVANYMVDVYHRLAQSDHSKGIGTKVLSCFVCIALFLSGTLTLIREYVSEYELFSSPEVAAAEFIKENTEPDAVFLTHNNHNNAVAALTGRNIVCGTGSYLYFHGIDYRERESSLKPLYEHPSESFESGGEKYGIDYIYIGNNERYNYEIDYSYFENKTECIYNAFGVQIYRVVNPVPSENDTRAS